MTTYPSGHCGGEDFVTGLHTRGDLEACLRSQLEHNSVHPTLLVALGVDVVGLKQINDTKGFLAGDKHLAAAAVKLIDASKSSHLRSRLGGDELVAIFLGDRAIENAIAAKEKMLMCQKPPKIRCGIVPAAAGDTSASLIERLYEAIRKA